MFTGSLAEMHLLSYGWLLYDSLWGLLQWIGVVAFPFVWVLFTHSFEAVKQYGLLNHRSSAAAFHAVTPTVLMMLLVFIVACLPVRPLQIDAWRYNKLCADSDTGQLIETAPVSPGDTGTTWNVMTDLTRGALRAPDAQIPILWDFVMRLGAGVNRALNSSGVCPAQSRVLDQQLREMRIADQTVRHELAQFVTDCYAPARSRLMKALQQANLTTVPTLAEAVNPDQYYAAHYRNWLSDIPPDQANQEVFQRQRDIDYVGSRFFLQTPGLYGESSPAGYAQQGAPLKASRPVAGWDYDPVRDCDHANVASGDYCTNPDRNPAVASNEGYPNCAQWWQGSGPNVGLRDKLYASALSSIASYMQGADPASRLNALITQRDGVALTKSDAWLRDKLVATALSNDTETSAEIMSVLNKVTDKTMHLGQTIADTVKSTGFWGVLGSAALTGAAYVAGAFSSVQAAAGAAATAVPLAIKAADFYATAWMVRQAYPIALAWLMMIFIALLPFVLVGTLFCVERLLQLTLVFLAIQFLSPWRYVVEYLDEKLFEMMYPDFSYIGTPVNITGERLIIDVVTTGMYVIVPFLVLWMASMTGASAAAKVGGYMNNAAQEAGRLLASGTAGFIGRGVGDFKKLASRKPKV